MQCIAILILAATIYAVKNNLNIFFEAIIIIPAISICILLGLLVGGGLSLYSFFKEKERDWLIISGILFFILVPVSFVTYKFSYQPVRMMIDEEYKHHVIAEKKRNAKKRSQHEKRPQKLEEKYRYLLNYFQQPRTIMSISDYSISLENDGAGRITIFQKCPEGRVKADSKTKKAFQEHLVGKEVTIKMIDEANFKTNYCCLNSIDSRFSVEDILLDGISIKGAICNGKWEPHNQLH